MSRMIRINKCSECQHSCHTGAFTPNGSVSVCRHDAAPRTYDMSKHTGRKKSVAGFHYSKVAKIEHKGIPAWCPLEVIPR